MQCTCVQKQSRNDMVGLDAFVLFYVCMRDECKMIMKIEFFYAIDQNEIFLSSLRFVCDSE